MTPTVIHATTSAIGALLGMVESFMVRQGVQSAIGMGALSSKIEESEKERKEEIELTSLM